ncbi:MAG: dihydrodipicolinate synthase family protein [Acidimicrobiales bacterium]|nr:dihydrodipicolinate synthase family protein [Acidimicrobiales bacterium]
MREPVFTGVAAALVTFFDDAGAVDHGATARHAAHLADRGVRAVLVAGTTGEAAALGADERLELLDAVREARPEGVAVLVGTGGLTLPEVEHVADRAGALGADGVLALAGPADADHAAFYAAVAGAAGDVGVLAYHYPAVGGVLPLEALPHLPVVGLKDSTGDPERLLGELEVFHHPVYVGSSSIVAYAGLLGCAGAILAAANLEPETCVAAFEGDGAAQRALLGAHRIVGADFPRGLKAELARRYGTSATCRL